ncbi:MAG: helix-turn-helix domain-containing protein [Bacilli bacterium]|nr:helix-turn-helix domain-containing protein [Bacilli bacterium]
MDLIKIGKFIADCRKRKNITQEELAEKLYITDRAVSKWERGLSLPDADKMLELCSILDINVNELLNGEKINMKDYEKKTNELLVELAKQEELKNKKMITDMYVLSVTAVVFYIGITLLAAYTLGEGTTFGIIVTIATIILVAVALYVFKLEIYTGYYECKKCHHRYVPNSYWKVMFSPHIDTTRYLKCPKCGKRSWSKKVMSKTDKVLK